MCLGRTQGGKALGRNEVHFSVRQTSEEVVVFRECCADLRRAGAVAGASL